VARQLEREMKHRMNGIVAGAVMIKVQHGPDAQMTPESCVGSSGANSVRLVTFVCRDPISPATRLCLRARINDFPISLSDPTRSGHAPARIDDALLTGRRPDFVGDCY
jgi:hypothetical protein